MEFIVSGIHNIFFLLFWFKIILNHLSYIYLQMSNYIWSRLEMLD